MPPTVYIYNSTLGCVRGHPSRGTAELFEHKMADIVKRLRTTRRPERADIFFHPACLVTAFFQVRSEAIGQSAQRAAIRALHAIEASVLLDIKELGFSHMPHVINALRCRHTQAPRVRPLGDPFYFHEHAFPRLWGASDPGRSPFAMICPEAPAEVHAAAIHIPYCQPPASAPPVHAVRSISVLFIGSQGRVDWHHAQGGGWEGTPQRGTWLSALNRTPSSHTVLLHSRDGREFHGSKDLKRGQLRFPNGRNLHHALLSSANFTMCPPGDAPDTQRIYSAISAGSIPLLDSSFQPPPVVPWDDISAPLRRHRRPDGSPVLTLPDAVTTAALLRGVRARARAFECDGDNPLMVRYLARELQRVAARPEGVDPHGVQRAAATVHSGHDGCRRLLHAWSDAEHAAAATSRASPLLQALSCLHADRNQTACACAVG